MTTPDGGSQSEARKRVHYCRQSIAVVTTYLDDLR